MPTVIKFHATLHKQHCILKWIIIICNSCVTVLQIGKEMLHIQLNSWTVCSNWSVFTAVLLWRTVTVHSLNHTLLPWAMVPLQKPKLVQESLNYPRLVECEGLLFSHNSPPVVRSLSQLNPLLILPFYFSRLSFSTTLSPTTGSKNRLFPSGGHTRTVHKINSYVCYRTDSSQPPSFDKLHIA